MAVSPLAVPCPWCEAKPGQPCTERPTSMWRWGQQRGRPVEPHGRRIRAANKPKPTPKPIPAPEIRP